MRILAIISGEYGRRHAENVDRNKPDGWTLNTWTAPSAYPLVIDYPEDFLPETLPAADLILAVAEHKGAAELLPDIAQMSGASGVIAAIDNEAWLPRGLARQLRGWLEDINVTCVTPKPLCSLTEIDYGMTRRLRVTYEHAAIAAFARHFGQPRLQLTVNPDSRLITSAAVLTDAVCGCARFTAEKLVGVSADEAAEKAGLLHHHFPCLASMGIDPDFGDTLMHVSGNVLKDNVAEQVRPFRNPGYIVPGKRSDMDE